MHFDITTAMMVTSLLTFCVGASLAFASSRYPPALRSAMRVWIGGLFLQTLPLFAVAVLGTSPGAGAIIVLNTVYALAYAEMGRALHLFTGQRHHGSLSMLLVGAVALISILFTYAWPQPGWRVALTEIPIAALQFMVARSILRQPRALRPADYLTGGLFLACTVIAVSRGIVEFLGPTLIAPDLRVAMASIVFVFSAILPTIGTIGFMLMCSDHLSDDLSRLAMIDPLTGVYNRRTLVGLAEKAIGDAQRDGTSFSLLAIDVDHFKSINDDYGHDTGDEALCGVVTLMRDALRADHVLSRIGGEEFAILLPGSGEAEACLTAERVRRHVANSPLSINGYTLGLRVSIGVATFGAAVPDLSSLLRAADRALYAAKRAGRDRTMVMSRFACAPECVSPLDPQKG
ncbi:GGDEF domain-containing protein [Dokdonella soli]